eukprot:14182229-Ditylum_brightwellii.AAC.1
MLQQEAYEVLDIPTEAATKKSHMKPNSRFTHSTLVRTFTAPDVQGMSPDQAIHHTGPVWIASVEQEKGRKSLLEILDSWDQTHSLINKVSGATNCKFPNM